VSKDEAHFITTNQELERALRSLLGLKCPLTPLFLFGANNKKNIITNASLYRTYVTAKQNLLAQEEGKR
jgi:hypothetical protein